MIGGVVLAAGEGSRFGGAKQLAELDGKPLLEHVLATVAAVPAIERFVVVLGAHASEIEARIDPRGAEVLVCNEWDEGQAASLRTGLSAVEDLDAAVILLGDQPGITPSAIEAVLAHFDGTRPLRAVYDGAPGHPVVMPRSLFAAAMRLEGDEGAKQLLEEAGVRRVEVGHLCEPTDIDTPADLDALR
ncbi:MAG TPA: nucleotidyltransferase family protein [Thermoleophilaceae bacterium]|nr:nucleotidyltransferase family protein [Thermoleophilaceae bacterium]